MREEYTIFSSEKNDEFFNSDLYDKNSIVLIRLNKVPNNFKSTTIITPNDCTTSYKWIIKSKEEVFKSFYIFGKELLSIIGEYNISNSTVIIFDNKDKEKKVKKLFNNFIKENGYPCLIDNPSFLGIEKLYIPEYEDILNLCIDLYIIEELRKWVTKIKNNRNTSYQNKKNGTTITIPVKKFKSLYDLFWIKLIPWINYTNYDIFEEQWNKAEIQNVLKEALPFSSANNETDSALLDKFTTVLYKSLVYYLLTISMGKIHPQMNITKSIPIFNSTTNEYRLYTTASSLIGIAYDYLLNNLTATKFGFNRVICAMPGCNNEFEKTNKSNFCGLHNKDEIRKYTNHKYYKKHKKEATEK